MGDKSGIGWTEATWNPIAGCSRVSEGCRHCYAEMEAHRLGQRLGQAKYAGLTEVVGGEPRWTGEVRLWESALEQPLRWARPRRIFVNSMSDLFHEAVPDAWICRIMDVIRRCHTERPGHVFQVLTKRPERMRDVMRRLRFDATGPGRIWVAEEDDGCGYRLGAGHRGSTGLANLWLGVSVEDQGTADARIPVLLETPAAVRWVSYEPALGPVNLEVVASIPTRDLLDWVVVGGESGRGARPFDLAWARATLAQGRAAGWAVFVKQLGSRPCSRNRSGGLENHHAGMGDLYIKAHKGDDPAEWPEDLRVQEYPGGGDR